MQEQTKVQMRIVLGTLGLALVLLLMGAPVVAIMVLGVGAIYYVITSSGRGRLLGFLEPVVAARPGSESRLEARLVAQAEALRARTGAGAPVVILDELAEVESQLEHLRWLVAEARARQAREAELRSYVGKLKNP